MKHTRARILSILAAAALTVCALPQITPLLLYPALTASAVDTANPVSEFESSQIGNAIQITAWNGTGDTVVIPSEINGMPVNEIRNSAFKGKSLLKEVVIPDSVERLGKNVFNGCMSLSKITLPKRLESIGEGAFCGCIALTEFTVPDGVTIIEYNTFGDCAGLKKITLPDSVTSIGRHAFDSCTALTAITFPAALTIVDNYAFWACYKLQTVILPDSVEELGDQAFADCRALREVTLPMNLNKIGNNTFWHSDKVTIKGYAGSYAETYAKENNIPFDAITQQTPRGDYNGDGSLSVADAVLLARFAAEDSTLTAEQLAGIFAADPDFDGDGVVTIADVAALLTALETAA